MGRASVKEHKTVYQLSREACGMTRAAASEAMVWVTESRIEKIESGKSAPTSDEVLAMAKAYKKASLCNYFCSRECAIGRRYVPTLQEKPIEAIVLEMLAALNALDKQKDRLIEITSDGVIHDDQIADFVAIRDQLGRVGAIADSLTLWFDDTVENGGVNPAILQQVLQEKAR